MRGQLFKINSPTVALDHPGKDVKFLHIPAGSAVEITSEPSGTSRLVSVNWNGRIVSMFVRDIFERGQPISGIPD